MLTYQKEKVIFASRKIARTLNRVLKMINDAVNQDTIRTIKQR